MIDFIDSSSDYLEFSESSVGLDYADYTPEYDGFSNDYSNFFEKDASYIVSRFDENGQEFKDETYIVVESSENSLILKSTLETEDGTIDKYIMISLKLSLIQEWTDIGFEHECVLAGHYEIEKINSDEKELTFMFKDGLQKVMKIRKL